MDETNGIQSVFDEARISDDYSVKNIFSQLFMSSVEGYGMDIRVKNIFAQLFMPSVEGCGMGLKVKDFFVSFLSTEKSL